MTTCLSCHQTFPDYKALALHITTSKKGHRQGKRWAAKYLSNQRILDRKVALQGKGYSPLTQQDIENKRDTRRELSGTITTADTICPKCKRNGIYQFPIEYTQSPSAWRQNKRLVKLCVSCGGAT